MAEIGTIIAIIQLADRVIELSKYWIEGVRDAESDLRSILIETSMLKSILENIRFLSECSNGLSTTLIGLSTSNGPLSHCQKILDDVVALIPSRIVDNKHQPTSEKDRLKLMMAKLGWATKRSKAQKLLDELQRYKAAINLALITDSLHDIKEIKTKTNLVLEALSDSEKREFCQWYQRTNPSSLHNQARGQFEEGTCKWINRMAEWEDWLQKRRRCLWVHGIPGAGKTILASHMVHQLEFYCENQVDSVALYYYCYFANNQNEAGPFLRWIITGICRHTNSVPPSAYKAYKRGREPSLPELLTALAEIIEPLQAVYIVVDALDESKPRDDLLKVIRDLVTDSRFDKIQVAATSRLYVDIERVLEDISTGVSMSNPSVTQDISLCVRAALQDGPRFKRWSKELLDEVESSLAARAKGMFRWAVCQLDRLRRLKGDANAVRKALKTLPRTLDETYQRIFAEVPEEDREVVRLCLGWIDFHNSIHGNSIPVTILIRALSSAQDNEEGGYSLDQEDLKEICGCLISISLGFGFSPARGRIIELSPSHRQEDVPVMKFAHYTVREFLSAESTSATSPAAYFLLGEQLYAEILRTTLSAAPKHNFDHMENSLTLADVSWKCREARSEEFWQRAPKAVFTYVLNSLETYCLLTTLEFLRGDPNADSRLRKVVDQPGLLDLVLDFCDPSRPHIRNISGLLSWWGCVLAGFTYSVPGVLSSYRFSGPKWGTQDHDAMQLFTVLGITNPRIFPLLADHHLSKSGRRAAEIFETPVEFEISNDQLDGLESLNPHISSLNEFMASKFSGESCEVFSYMMSLPGIPSSADHATALLQAISMSHWHTVCQGSSKCFLKHLLDLGASPHGIAGHATRPIQRVAGKLDWEGIEILMSAGANINDVGDPAGIKAISDTDGGFFQFRCDAFKNWAGRSPLWIFYHHCEYRDMRFTRRRPDYRTLLEKTAEVLLRHGAKALRLEGGRIVEDPGVRDRLMRPFEEWDLPDNNYEAPAFRGSKYGRVMQGFYFGHVRTSLIQDWYVLGNQMSRKK